MKYTFNRMNNNNASKSMTLSLPELAKINGGDIGDGCGNNRIIKEVCPFYQGNHVFIPTGESRPTSAWFYKTEEHYVCRCGKGYWRAGWAHLFYDWD